MENNKIICTNCGKEMKNTDKFCISCGTKNEACITPVASEKKPFKSKRLMIGAGVAVAVLLVIFLIAPTIYALVSPTNYVKSAIYNTVEAFVKDSKQFVDVPTISSLFSSSNNNSQAELYLKIEDINAGLPIDTAMLEDYGLKFIKQSNEDSSVWNFNLALMERENEIVDGTFYYDKEKIALEAPKLFEDILGISIKEKNDTEDTKNTELNEFRSTVEILSELIESSKDLEKIYGELAKKYAGEFIDLAKFEKDEANKNLYIATLDGEDIVSIITEFLTELFNNEDFKEYLASTMYLSEGYNTKEYYVDMVENMALSLPDEIDYMLEEIEVGDLELNVEIENKTVTTIDASFSIISNEEKLKVKYAMDFNNEKDNLGFDFELKFGVDSYDTIEGSLVYVKDGKDLKRNVSFDINISDLDGTMSFDFVEILKDSKKYENSITYNINDGYEDVKIKIDTIGSYKDNKRFDYEDIELSATIDENLISFNLSGYVSNSKIKSIDTIDSKKIIYIEELDEIDFNELYEEINENLFLIFQSLGGII